MRGMVFALCLVTAARAPAATPPACPASAGVTVFVENLSDADAVDVTLDGELAAEAVTCEGTGATGYEGKHLSCTGHGTVRCGELTDLQPGLWVHRLVVSVPGSDQQRQSQRMMVVASGATHVSNALLWTVYPRTFIVPHPTADDLQSALDRATAYTLCNPGPALVTFSADAFPGAGDPRRIDLLSGPTCKAGARNSCGPLRAPGGCPYDPGSATDPCSGGDCTLAGLCVGGDRLVIDGLDHDARPGGVILSVDTCQIRTMRAYGSDDVFRGLVFRGSQKTDPDQGFDADTVALSGSRARRNRLEQSIVYGPTAGDGVAVDDGAGQPDDGTGANVIVDSEISGARDKGVKIDDGVAVIARSCVHDNRNGGIQVTDAQHVLLAGHATATENVVQHNVPGDAQNGLSVVGERERSSLETEGNIVRFSGARGLSTTDNATATFRDDYVADSQIRGSTVDATADGPGASPAASFRGVAMVCNRLADLTGICDPQRPGEEKIPCTAATATRDCCSPSDGDDCGRTCTPQDAFRYGAVTFAADGHDPPDVDYGNVVEPGRNVFASNTHDSADANFRVEGIATVIPAQGNQWSHCSGNASCPDVSSTGAPVSVEPIADPLATDDFVLTRVTPSRPHAGDIVRVYGHGFDAINGNPVGNNCASVAPTCVIEETCSCAIANGAVQAANMSKIANRLSLAGEDGAVLTLPSPPPGSVKQTFFFPDAVTPAMVAFRMPFDCFAPLTLKLEKRNASGKSVPRTITLCDPHGCAGEPEGTPCDDGSVCTGDDRCDGAGQCIGGAPQACGTCRTCDAVAGCVPSPSSAACDDGDACTQGDHCAGSSSTCLPGVARACDGDCATGACDPAHGCMPKPAGSVCRAASGVCDVEERCDGTHDVCPANGFADRSTVCRPAAGPCDSPETCTGRDGSCGRDAHRLSTFVCRPAAGACDVAEHCDGVSNECPPDALAPAATVCRPAAGSCDLAEACTGQNVACPPDVHQPAGIVCRPVAGDCDVAETCDGTSAACPDDRFRPSTATCRSPAGVCDVAETCSGTSPGCGPDVLAPATTVCRRAVDPCDVDDTCDGTSRGCPATDLRKTGAEGVTCAFARAMPAPSCVDQAVPARIPRLFDRAGVLVGRAFAARGAKRCGRLRHASHVLASDLESNTHAVHRKKPAFSLDCEAALHSVLSDARTRVQGEIASACSRHSR